MADDTSTSGSEQLGPADQCPNCEELAAECDPHSYQYRCFNDECWIREYDYRIYRSLHTGNDHD